MTTDDEEDSIVEFEEELVGNDPSQRNWRGIVIALLVILVVCSLIALAILIVTPNSRKLKDGEAFSFEDMFSEDFKPRSFNHQWIAEQEVYVYRSREGELLGYDAEHNHSFVLLNNADFKQLASEKFSVSPDLSYILVAYKLTPIYRHSYKARYKIYSRSTEGNEGRAIDFPQGSQWADVDLQYAGWATLGNALTFVHGNNLYYQASPQAEPVQVTTSGNDNLVFNGVPDWLYEEEILSSAVSHWMSPDARHISYLEINDSSVPLYQYPEYGEYSMFYSHLENIPYPKAGNSEKHINPTVRLYVTDVSDIDGSRQLLSPPAELAHVEHYLLGMKWLDNSRVLVTWANRAQNVSIITVCHVTPGTCHTNRIEMKPNGWVRMNEAWAIEGGDKYLMVMSKRDRSNYWMHIAAVSTVPENQTGVLVFLTQGGFDISSILSVDSQYVYFLSTGPNATKRHLYRASLSELDKHPECVSCDYDADDCQYVSASFSARGAYYVMGCLGPAVPYYVLRSTVDSRDIMLEDNYELSERLKKKALPRRRFEEIPIEGGQKLYLSMMLPPLLKTDKDHITQYPLLMHTYGGPGSQKVTQQFNLGWSTYLSGSENVIVASVDGRGTRNRGENFLYEVYGRLGTVEVQDQLAAVRNLTRTYRYVDQARQAMWGWSYGGFVTAHALGDRSNLLPCGIAVAPVTDWRYYDTAYTERYMRFASTGDNFQGYDRANVSAKAEQFAGKELLLIHGTADDNVHFQHSAQLMKALTQAGVMYRSQIYTDKNHALSGPKTSRHLYRTMTNFLKYDCWDGGKPRDVRTEDLVQYS